MLEPGSLDFSFSGLKSAVLNTLNTCRMKGDDVSIPDLAASFQAAVIDVLVAKTLRALERQPQVKTLALAGGVAANSLLRDALAGELKGSDIRFIYPSAQLCTDNGAMIAMAGYYHYLKGRHASWKLNAVPGLTL
jgi:N6-L-threonylcarbamoyladenine synthase